MARKTMAERYAAQRSRREVRRRSLPRLSDEATTALQDREVDEVDDTADDSLLDAEGVPREPTVTVARRPQRTDAVRRVAPTSRGGLTTTAVPQVDYGYVIRDLRRIAVTAVVMLALLIVLNLIVQNLIH